MSETTTANKRAMTREQAYEWVKDAVRECNKEESEKLEKSFAEIREAIEAAKSETNSQAKTFQALAQRLTTPEEPKLEKGLLAGGFFRTLAAAKKQGRSPLEVANEQYGESHAVTRVLTAGSGTGGGFLVPGQVASEVIEVLRAKSVVERMNPRRVPLDNGTLSISRINTGSTASWVGEGGNLAHQTPAFGQVTLTAKKLGCTVAVSNDLLMYATSDVDGLVRDDLARSMASTVDAAYIRGDGTAAQPKGMAQLENINTDSANASVSLANVTIDLGTAVQNLLDSNVDLSNPHWIGSPRSWRYLFTVRDGNGNYAFQPELILNQNNMVPFGTIFGKPFWQTTNIPDTLGSGSDSEFYFVNADDLVIGQASSLEIESSDVAAYYDGSAVQAAFSRDVTVIRAILRVDFNARHDQSIDVITGVTWGA